MSARSDNAFKPGEELVTASGSLVHCVGPSLAASPGSYIVEDGYGIYIIGVGRLSRVRTFDEARRLYDEADVGRKSRLQNP